MQNNTQTLAQAGVWLDQRTAIIISRASDTGDFVIQEKLHGHEEQRGGSEHTMNSGRQADTQKYFKELANRLTDYSEILVFGPGTAQEQFRNFLGEEAHFDHTKVTLDTAEQQTDSQMIAQVRNFFN